jgi:hypothetical protein
VGKLKLKCSTKSEPLPTWKEFADLVDRANTGDSLAIKELGRTLDRHPEIVTSVADLATHIEQDLIDRLAHKDELLKQSLTKMVAKLRNELVADPDCPVQRLAANRVILHQLEVWLLTSKFPDASKVPPGLVKPVQLAKHHAERRARSALKAMQMLRKLAPKRAKEGAPMPTQPVILRFKRKPGKSKQTTERGTSNQLRGE